MDLRFVCVYYTNTLRNTMAKMNIRLELNRGVFSHSVHTYGDSIENAHRFVFEFTMRADVRGGRAGT